MRNLTRQIGRKRTFGGRSISDHRIQILNVAGPRASKEPQIAAFVKKVLEEAFFPRPDPSISGPGER